MGSHRTRAIALVFGLALTASPVSAQAIHPISGHRYFRTELPVSVAMGRLIAAAAGGTLVVYSDEAEEDWVDEQFPGAKWLGLSDELAEGTFTWEDGSPLTYQRWGTGQPDGWPGDADYVVAYGPFSPSWWDFDDESDPALGRFAVIETSVELGPTVEEFSGLMTPGLMTPEEVQLSWVSPATFDGFELYRGTELIATLPGTATDFTEPAQPENRYWIVPLGGAQPARPALCRAVPDGIQLFVEGGDIAAGGTGSARVILGSDVTVAGYSYGVCHDPAVVELLSVEVGSVESEVTPYPSIDFHSTWIGDDGFTVGAVLFGAGLTFIPIGYHELDVAEYATLVPAPASSPLEFCVIGDPAVAITVVPHGSGSGVDPAVQAGQWTVVDGFRRGDGNGDGVIDLADPVWNMEVLFYGAASLCMDAQDTNDDGALDLADPIYGLAHLFSGGAPPPPPIGDCGTDPTPDPLGCAIPPVCL